MGSGTLSQSEVDRLLGSAPNGVSARGGDEQSVQLYDFRRPHRVSKERLRTLEAMYERMVKSLEGWVIGRVRGQIEMRLQSVEQLSFGEFTLSLSTPCASFILDIEDAGGQQAIIDVGQDFALYLVDRFFGGGGQQASVARPLTRVERMAIRAVVDRATSLVQEIWADHIALKLDVSAFESVPDILLQTANRDDPVLVANIEVKTGEMTSLMLVCLPFAVLDKFFTHMGKRRVNTVTGSEQERAVSRSIAEQSLRATRVTVAARLAEFRVPIRDLASLTEGGVIATALPHNSPVRVLIGTQERFVGTAGRVGTQLAVQVQGPVHESLGTQVLSPEGAVHFAPSIIAADAPSAASAASAATHLPHNA